MYDLFVFILKLNRICNLKRYQRHHSSGSHHSQQHSQLLDSDKKSSSVSGDTQHDHHFKKRFRQHQRREEWNGGPLCPERERELWNAERPIGSDGYGDGHTEENRRFRPKGKGWARPSSWDDGP